jgi:hypothetical protein
MKPNADSFLVKVALAKRTRLADPSALQECILDFVAEEGALRTAGRLFNIAAVLLAQTGMAQNELSARLHLAFRQFDIERIFDTPTRAQ